MHHPDTLAASARPAVRPLLLSGALALMAGLSACGSDDAPADPVPPPPRSLAESCPAYAPASLPNGARITGTEIRPARGDVLTEACIVRGEIVTSPGSTILWAVELPELQDWNGKTLTIGGGGFDGYIPTDTGRLHAQIMPAANAFVRISSDSGHQSRGFDWAVDDDALRNHGYLANHLVLHVGQKIAEDFFGRQPSHRYLIGHSNGGRSGFAAAQRFPDDYHGIVALQPAISQQAHEANVGPILMTHIFSDPGNWLSQAKVDLFARAELGACDALDGLEDGIIANEAACQYLPYDLLCTGADDDSCLTAGQIETIRLVYTDKHMPVSFTQGQTGYERFGRGGAATSDWRNYLFGTAFDGPAPFNYMVGDEATKVVERNPEASLMAHDPTRYPEEYLRLALELDATDPDISEFVASGGKLLVWYGTADACVSVHRTTDYLDTVRQTIGEERYSQAVRYLATPGIGHGLDGPGAARIDFLGAIEDWVENGVAPDRLVGSHYRPGSTEPDFQRPVCQYPLFPRYTGGDPARAESFMCSAT